MPDIYVSSAGGTGVWAGASATLSAGLTASAAGDVIFVAQDHNETTAAAITLASPGTAAAPVQIYCANRATTVRPVVADLRTTGLVATTGASAITFAGHAYCYGISFTAGSGTSVANAFFGNTSSANWIMEACKIILGNTSSGSAVQVGAVTAGQSYRAEWINTTVRFGVVGQGIATAGASDLIWRNTAAAVDPAGASPTNLFLTGATTNRHFNALVKNVDLSFLGSGKVIVGARQSNGVLIFENCRLDAAVLKVPAPGAGPTAVTNTTGRVLFRNCESSLSNFRFEAHGYAGSQFTETTITRTGTQATDKTQAIAARIVTNNACRPAQPFEMTPIVRWNDLVGSVTVEVFGRWGSGVVPTDKEVWMEIDYLGDATSTLGLVATSRATSYVATLLGSGTDVTSDASAWGGSTTSFKLVSTFTTTAKGPIKINVKVGVASTTLYIDPAPVISGQTIDRAFAA